MEAAAIRKKILGVLLRNARVRTGMTIKDAAEATGFSSRRGDWLLVERYL
jgi:DNA-binding Lrp family transcriptional regulator